MKFSIIVAVDLNNGIGFRHQIPWSIPAELKYFQKVTTGDNNVVIMGRKTWDSIPVNHKPLKNRKNMVISRSKDLNLPVGVYLADSLENALAQCENLKPKEVFIIGGAQIYIESISHPDCNKIYLTRVQEKFECDTFFPQIDPNRFELVDFSEPVHENGFSYQFQLWEALP